MIINNFKNESISKGDLATRLYSSPGEVFDCALPQHFIDKVNQRFPSDQLESFGNISGHLVYIYDQNDKTEYVAPVTKIGCKILGTLALYA